MGWVSGNQFPTFDAEFKFAKIQNCHVDDGWMWGGASVESNFQLLMLSSNLLKSNILMFKVGGGGSSVETNFQLLLLSSNLLKSKIPMFREWGGGGVQWKPISNF